MVDCPDPVAPHLDVATKALVEAMAAAPQLTRQISIYRVLQAAIACRSSSHIATLERARGLGPRP